MSSSGYLHPFRVRHAGRAALPLACATLVALPGCKIISPPLFTASRSLATTIEHDPDGDLTVDAVDGEVRAEASLGYREVSIEATLTCGGDTQTDADYRLATADLQVGRDEDGHLVIGPVFPDGQRRGDSASVMVTMPAVQGVTLRTTNANVTARNLRGDLEIETTNGDVQVSDHHGPIRVRTVNGRIEAVRIGGTVDALNANGPVMVLGAGGPTGITTTNAPIVLTLRPGQSGPVRAVTTNDTISVRVGQAFAGTVTMETGDEPIVLEDRAGRITTRRQDEEQTTVIIGQEGEVSRLTTSDGAIRLIIEDEGAAAVIE